jgi:hypothetical protein
MDKKSRYVKLQVASLGFVFRIIFFRPNESTRITRMNRIVFEVEDWQRIRFSFYFF